MTEKVDLFTLGFSVDENGNVFNDKSKLVEYLEREEFIKPVNFYFLIAVPTIEDQTPGGIFLPVESKDSALVGNNIGRVIGKGGTVGGATGAYADCAELEIGDYIGYNPHAGLPENYLGHRVICIADESIRITVPNPLKHTDGIFKAFKVTGIN